MDIDKTLSKVITLNQPHPYPLCHYTFNPLYLRPFLVNNLDPRLHITLHLLSLGSDLKQYKL